MAILNDYRCTACLAVQERWTDSPAPREIGCKRCGGVAARLFAAVGLSGRATQPSAPVQSKPTPALCSQYPGVPGLCHMSESAGRMWVARYQRDNRTMENELAKQEARAAVTPLTIEDAISHNHQPAPTAAVESVASPA